MKMFIKFIKIAILFLITIPLYSSYSSVMISPKRVVFEKGQKISDVLLINKSNNAEEYRLSIIEQKMINDGSLKKTEIEIGQDKFARKFLIVSPRRILIGPQSSQKVRIMSRIKNNTPNGEYRSHLLVRNIPPPSDPVIDDKKAKGLAFRIKAIYGMSIPIIIRKGDLYSKITISDASVETKDNKKFISFVLNRTGNKSTYGNIKVLNDGKAVARLKGISIYLSVKTRKVTVELMPDISITSNTFQIEYVEEGSDQSITFNFKDKE